VGLDRPPRPWALDGDEQLDPAAIGFRCANGCVGITAAGQLVPTLGGSQRAGGGRPWRRPPVEHNRHDKKSVEARACLDRLGTYRLMCHLPAEGHPGEDINEYCSANPEDTPMGWWTEVRALLSA
jgi:hypothetical protein